MLFSICYVLFVVSALLGGSIYVGPMTPRQYFTVLMALYCLKDVSYICSKFDKHIVLYVVFLLFMCVSFSFEGHFIDYLKILISMHLVALVGYFSTLILVKKNRNYNILTYTLLTLGGINAVICLGQYLGVSSALALGLAFCDLNNESIFTNLNNMMEGESGAYLFGLLGHPVDNGYFMLVVTFLPLYFYNRKISVFWRTSIILTITFFLFILLIIQQRSCFGLAVLLLMLFVLRVVSFNKLISYFILLLPFLIVILSLVDWNTIFEGSRYMQDDVKEESRYSIYILSISYIFSHFLFGGYYSAIAYIGNAPHNIIFNAFVYSGLCGGIAILALYYRQIKVSYINTRYDSPKLQSLSLALLAYSLNGLLHNNSLVTGDVMIWILWACIISNKGKKLLTDI